MAVAAINSASFAESAVAFPGTVVMVDEAAKKIAVKKDQGGTRFTFVADEKTQYAGVGGLDKLKKGDSVTVTYVVKGSQYIAQKIAKR
jgi:Cu/Ag efflux protein CusF